MTPDQPQGTCPAKLDERSGKKRSKGMLVFYVAMGAVALLLVAVYFALTPRMAIPEDAPVRYENRLVRRMATVPDPLAKVIVRKLNGAPDRAQWRTGMGLDTRKHLRVGPHTLQVMKDEVILLDDWGVRQWIIVGIEQKLEALLTKDQK